MVGFNQLNVQFTNEQCNVHKVKRRGDVMLRLRNTLMSVLVLMVSTSFAVDVNISGKLDLSKAGTFKVIKAQVAGTDIVDTVNNDGTYLLRNSGVGIKYNNSKHVSKPVLAWKDIGKSVKFVSGNSSNYVVDAYTFDGKLVTQGAKFINGVAVVGTGSQTLYTKLRDVGKTFPTYASRSMDTTATDSGSVVGSVIFIVTTCDSVCRTDTLTEVPVTKWDTILSTKYVVQRNVKVTVPAKYAADSVKIGYYNVYNNPQNFFSIALSNYKARRWSGYIYSAYDSASYGSDSYLYSAVAILKHKDSVIAFSDSIARVTAKTGDVEFDSSELVNKIVSRPLADTAVVPWYAFTVSKSAVNMALNRVMKLDSMVTYSDTLVDSAWLAQRPYTFSGLGQSIRLDGEVVRGYRLTSPDTSIAVQPSKEYDDSTVFSALDSVRVTFVADTTDTTGYVSSDTVGSRVNVYGTYEPVYVRGYSKELRTVAGTQYTISLPVSAGGVTAKNSGGISQLEVFVRLPVKYISQVKTTANFVYRRANKHYK